MIWREALIFFVSLAGLLALALADWLGDVVLRLARRVGWLRRLVDWVTGGDLNDDDDEEKK